jgi:tRNA threonylcarbamoyladenosine biosynthesis protein TsaE
MPTKDKASVMRTARREFELADETGTARLGRALAAELPPDAVVALHGTLGAGKTRLVQALAEAAGVNRRDVVSPTFVLVQEYYGLTQCGEVTIFHIDAYRLPGADEFRQLGGEEYLNSPGWVLIEWAERIAECLPPEILEITLEVTGDETRRATLVGQGDAYAAIVERLVV